MDKFFDEENIEKIKQVLFYAYEHDVYFPKSCGKVSMMLTTIFQNSSLQKDYNIIYIRGYFKNEKEYDNCYCLDVDSEFKRGDNIKNFPCIDCDGCDYIIPHSWIELKNKNTNKVIIIDFTSIQFTTNFEIYSDELSCNKFKKDELYNYLIKRSKFIIKENEKEFFSYIPFKKLIAEFIIEKTKRIISEGNSSELIDCLNEINYKF